MSVISAMKSHGSKLYTKSVKTVENLREKQAISESAVPKFDSSLKYRNPSQHFKRPPIQLCFASKIDELIEMAALELSINFMRSMRYKTDEQTMMREKSTNRWWIIEFTHEIIPHNLLPKQVSNLSSPKASFEGKCARNVNNQVRTHKIIRPKQNIYTKQSFGI